MRRGDDLGESASLLIVMVVSVVIGVYLGRVVESINILTECDKKAHYEFSSMIFIKPIAVDCKVKK